MVLEFSDCETLAPPVQISIPRAVRLRVLDGRREIASVAKPFGQTARMKQAVRTTRMAGVLAG